MNDQEVEKTIRDYLPQVIHMSLATSMDNKPWVCEVHFSFDDQLNLYFRSMLDRRHSKEIMQNPFVAGNMVTPHHKNQKVRGVYFEGRAELLEDVDARSPAFMTYSERLSESEDILAQAQQEGGARFFKIIPQKLYLFDGYGDPAKKYTLEWSKK